MHRSSARHCSRVVVIVAALLAGACDPRPAPTPAKPAATEAKVETDSPQDGAVSMAPIEPAKAGKASRRNKFDWSPVALKSGQAWISCQLFYEGQGDGNPLPAMDRRSLEAALVPCIERGVLRLRYKGRIASDFATLVERVARVADTLQIRKRVLDLNSAGGQVEDAIRAGDTIAETRWTLWVREDSACHSACVLVLSGGDVRMLAGRIGIHRVIRMSSTATTRAELNAELRVVYDRIRDYLERNGTSTAVADLMKAVPNRNLRLLTDEELLRFGLEGINSAQDDLDRLRLQRECGEDFVARRDDFARAFDRQCRTANDVHDQNACGLALRARFGFPDASCPAESPLSEFDLGQAEPAPAQELMQAATGEETDAASATGEPGAQGLPATSEVQAEPAAGESAAPVKPR
jgi:ATP-dependent protease ClpP protease subunit